MKLEAVYKRSVNLLINPKLEWDVIKSENKPRKEVIHNFAVPAIFLLALCTVIGNAIYATRILYSLPYVLFSGIAMFVIGYIGVILGALIINEITPSFNSKKDRNLTFNLVIYSLSAYSAFLALAILLPSPLYQIRYFGFYSVYLFWVGAGSLSETPSDNKVGFVFVSNLILFGIFSILYMVFDIIIKGNFGLTLIFK
jgi:hypothetical protein